MPHRVMIVEDEPEIRLFVGMMLRTEGYEVLEAEDGRAALALLEKGPRPEIVLLDVMMPGLNGWQVFEQMQLREEWSQIPVLLLTALAQRSDVERAVQLGVDGYLTKPFEPADLIVKIEETLRHRDGKKSPGAGNQDSDG
jgi:DNA-binding response OmpR family regulator